MAYQFHEFTSAADLPPPVPLLEIVRRLGRDHYGPGRRVTYVTKLVDERGFPAPYPSMIKGALVSGVTRDSRWPRAAVETWFDNFLPPEAHAALDAAAMAAAAADMDDRAGNLRLVGGTDHG